MNRLEFMQKLELLLYDISESEKAEAMQYYTDYLNDAGIENEQEVLESLGTPEKVARTIKEGLSDNGDGGEFTETRYQDAASAKERRNEVVETGKRKGMSGGMLTIIIILAVLTAPVWMGAATGILGVLFGIIAAILGVFLTVVCLGIGLLVGAVVMIGLGIGTMFAAPLAGICFIGAGILMSGFSLFFIWLTVWICRVVFPCIMRGIVSIFSKLFHKERGERR